MDSLWPSSLACSLRRAGLEFGNLRVGFPLLDTGHWCTRFGFSSSSRQHKTQCNAYRCTMVYITKRPMFLITARGRTLNLSLAIQRGRSGRQTTLWAQFQRVGYNRTIWIGAVGRSTTSSFSNSHISYLVEAINCVESSAITLNPSS